jgi:hypothetical protein
MIHQNQRNPGAGAAPGEKEGGPAPTEGARVLWGGIVIEAENNTIVVQKYNKQEGKHYRWRVVVSRVVEVSG